jgi:hypothetical protein
MKYYYIFGIILLLTIIGIPAVFAEDTLKIDTILKHDFDNYYNFPKQTPLILSGNHDMCPSNDCKMIFDKAVDDYMDGGVTLKLEPNKMTVNGYLKLAGSGYGPAIISTLFECESINVEKNTKLGTTKYICPEGSGWFIPAENQDIQYNYDYSASFELPSGHFTLNGTNRGNT